MTINFNTDENFWTLHPDFKLALSFKSLYKSDKSRNKETSSKLMWYIALAYHITSRYYNLPDEEKSAVIGGDYMDDEQYYDKNKEKLIPLINDFKKISLSPAQRHLMEWDKKLNERSKFISSLEYNLDTFEDLDKMAVNTPKLYDTFKKIKEDLSKEEGEGTGKGGAIASLND